MWAVDGFWGPFSHWEGSEMIPKETLEGEFSWAAAHAALRLSMVFGAGRGLGTGTVQSSEEE